MNAAVEPIVETPPRIRRLGVTPAVELVVLCIAVAVAVATYLIVKDQDGAQTPLTPPLVALVLVANLLAGGALIVLLGRRVAKGRAARSAAGGGGQLHVRLVAIFSVLATVPTILLAVVASLLFQYGAEFWFSGQARGMLENSQRLAQESYAQLLSYVDNENIAMANDVNRMLFEYKWETDSPQFANTFAADVFQRSLANSVLFSISPQGQFITHAIVKNSDRNPMQDLELKDIQKLGQSAQSVSGTNSQRTYSLAKVKDTDLYLYSTREVGAAAMAERLDRVKIVFTNYQQLLERTRSIQLQFNVALLLMSLLIVGIAVWVALELADRLVRPVNELVDAARKVAGGDLAARVSIPRSDDEVGALASAFNTMTERLQEQNSALVATNAQSESRRGLIEAVISGVTAGVISVGADRSIRLINSSAMALLKTSDAGVLGWPLAQVAPELDALLDGHAREAVAQITTGGEARTLAVKITRDEAGQVLTFDDITQQLLDQRRAAWSDVARRIAHEIKNPLTPIQLAAERLQRRYGKQIDSDDGVFAKLTDTIIRQVRDLRRIVDEFSSFARMPKPVFRSESLVDLARQAMFLHEVAHPAIHFAVSHDESSLQLVCDRRQIGQALTNIVKNAVEAIESRPADAAPGDIALTLRAGEPGHIVLEVSDNGIGLPVERDRIIEPYMTTRAGGTGLGLAIVTKIVEEHFGTIGFSDRPGGGSVVTITFDTGILETLADDATGDTEARDEDRLAMLTRTRNA
jgi:two-component system nitrogen regulation sensor histidine kinase NtrY